MIDQRAASAAVQESMSPRFLLGALCAIATVTIWAGWLVVMRVGMASNLAVVDLIALRFAIAGGIMLPVVISRGWALDQLGWTGLAAIAIGGGAAYTLAVGAGLAFAPVAHASAFTQGVLPLTTAVMAVIVLGEKLTVWRKVGIVLIVAGAVIVAGLGVGDFGGRESIGQAIFLSATLLWAGYTVALRKARLDGLHATAIACVASLLVYLPIYLTLFGPRVLAAPWDEVLWQGLYQGVLTGVVSLILFGRAVTLLGASAAGSFIALGPAIATLLAIPILGEWPTAEDWTGIAAISVGVYLASGGPLPRRLTHGIA
jgi:drug/metabolite transporter (DMT)-like permease